MGGGLDSTRHLEVRTKASTAHPSISSARTARTYSLNAHDDPNEQNVAVLFDDFV